MAISTTHPLTGHLFRFPVGAIPWPKVWSYCQELTRSAPAGEVTTGTLQERPRNLMGSFRWNDSLLSGILQEPSQVEVKQMRLVCNEVAILNTLSLPGLKMLWNCDSFHAAPRAQSHFPFIPQGRLMPATPGPLLPLLALAWSGTALPEATFWPGCRHPYGISVLCGTNISDCNWFCRPAGSMGPSLGSAVDFLESLSSPKRLAILKLRILGQ